MLLVALSDDEASDVGDYPSYPLRGGSDALSVADKDDDAEASPVSATNGTVAKKEKEEAPGPEPGDDAGDEDEDGDDGEEVEECALYLDGTLNNSARGPGLTSGTDTSSN